MIVPEDYRNARWAACSRVMSGGPARLDGQSAHLPVLCSDGQVWTFPGRFGFIRDPDGNVCAALATYCDGDHEAAPFSPIDSGTTAAT